MLFYCFNPDPPPPPSRWRDYGIHELWEIIYFNICKIPRRKTDGIRLRDITCRDICFIQHSHCMKYPLVDNCATNLGSSSLKFLTKSNVSSPVIFLLWVLRDCHIILFNPGHSHGRKSWGWGNLLHAVDRKCVFFVCERKVKHRQN